MSVTPFPAGAVIARLRSKVSLLRDVGSAADLATALKTQPKALPCAFVLVEERGGEPGGASGGVLVQPVAVSVQVVLMVLNVRTTDTGSAARDDMDALATAVDGALVNWTPGVGNPLWFQAGRDERFAAGLLVHQRIYRSNRRNQVNRNP